MVLLTIRVRPKNGYTYYNKIKTVQVDSSERLEKIISDLKLDKKTDALYHASSGKELPLNSSLASHNIQDGDALETCSSPLLSTVLSAVLRDLDDVQKLADEDRTENRLKLLLDGPMLDPWPNRWSFEDVKRRTICVAFMKGVLQRDGRHAERLVPSCPDLTALYLFMKSVWLVGPGNQRNTLEQCFKPSARNRGGKPSVLWELLQQKLDKAIRIFAHTNGKEDLIESFVKAENLRHGVENTPGKGTPRRRNTSASASTSQQQRRKFPPGLNQQAEIKCTTCQTSRAECVCLDPSCPFHHQLCCNACFSENHPRFRSNHERISLTDARGKAAVKQFHPKKYCPQYASGPFAVLCALSEAMERNVHGGRELSLTESRLKRQAQPRCRSNLYDRQAKGRNAFACMESLADRGLIRKEMIPGSNDAKYSLLPTGEQLAGCCLVYERSLNTVLQNSTNSRNKALGTGRLHVTLVIDTREDATYADRLVERCNAQEITHDRRELPCGDYLFTTQQIDRTEVVLPLVVERKSWSDLADSVCGKGHKRLECVRIGSAAGPCNQQNCQLCRMKRSGCSKIMFVIEGARCLARDGQENLCCDTGRCKYCRELQERHGPDLRQDVLEKVLFRLQAEHNCLVHFTRGYNETIDSLFMIRDILGAGENGVLSLTYQQFCSNSRRPSTGVRVSEKPTAKVVEWPAQSFVRSVCRGKAGESIRQLFDLKNIPRLSLDRSSGTALLPGSNHVVDLDQSFSVALSGNRKRSAVDDDVVVLDGSDHSRHKTNRASDQIVHIDSEEECDEFANSQETVQILEGLGWASAKPKASTDESVVDIDSEDERFAESQNSMEVWAVRPSPESLGRDKKPAAKRRKVEVVALDSMAAAQQSGATLVLLLTGMYEYDTAFCKDTDRLWTGVYADHGDKSSRPTAASIHTASQQGGFSYYATERVRQLEHENPELPLVPREELLFWILYAQLRQGIRVHVFRESSYIQEFRRHLDGHATEGEVAGGASVQAGEVARRVSETEAYCIVCHEVLGKQGVEAISCGHCFHIQCLQQWFRISKTRRCPTCNNPSGGAINGGGGDGDGGASFGTPNHSLPPRNNTSRPSSTNIEPKGSNVDMSIREARLLRFGSNATMSSDDNVRATETGSDQRRTGRLWKCSACTFVNGKETDACEMCISPRILQRGDVLSVTPLSADFAVDGTTGTVTAMWTCDSCTLQNTADLSRCSACNARNPFKVDDKSPDSKAQTKNDSKTQTTNYEAAATATAAPTPSSNSNTKCGACGRNGHNRGSATAHTCPVYYSDEEVQRRRKKKEALQRKASESATRMRQLASEEENRAAQLRSMENALADLKKAAESSGIVIESEVRRLQKAKERAEKSARKLG
jgi:hypothetical protein